MAAAPFDIEHDCHGHDHFHNKSIRSFLWTGVTVKVKDRHTKKDKTILSNVNGLVKEGELLAVMGPS